MERESKWEGSKSVNQKKKEKNANRWEDEEMKYAGEKRGKIEMVENKGRKPERHKGKEVWDKIRRKGNKSK